jgi:hypothetical protein
MIEETLSELSMTGIGQLGPAPATRLIATESVAVAVPLLLQVKVMVTGVDRVG